MRFRVVKNTLLTSDERYEATDCGVAGWNLNRAAGCRPVVGASPRSSGASESCRHVGPDANRGARASCSRARITPPRIGSGSHQATRAAVATEPAGPARTTATVPWGTDVERREFDGLAHRADLWLHGLSPQQTRARRRPARFPSIRPPVQPQLQ